MNHRRIGKIARLPADIREQVNEMLDDGLEYNRIIDWLTEQGHPGIVPKNLSNWKDGGYEDWLNHCQRLAELEVKSGYAIEVAQQADPAKFQNATVNLTCLQFFEMLNRFDPLRLAAAVNLRPEKYPALINSLARFTREFVGLKRFHEELTEKAKAEAARDRVDEAGLDNEGVARILRALRIRYPREFLSQISDLKSEIASLGVPALAGPSSHSSQNPSIQSSEPMLVEPKGGECSQL